MNIQNRALHTALKKRASQFLKPFKSTKRGFSSAQLEGVRRESQYLREWLVVFESCFSKGAQAEAHKVLARLLPQLEEFRCTESTRLLLEKLVKAEKNLRTDGKSTSILEEFESIRDIVSRKASKQLKQIKPKRISGALQKDFKPNGLEMPVFLVKYLNQRRGLLFNQLVQIIRVAKQEDLTELSSQIQKFCFVLEIAIDTGFQKGKRLLQTLHLLRERLDGVCDEELLRRCLQDIEQERARQPERISDIQKLRLIRIRLGIQQARTLQAFHSQIPPALQVLKKNIS